LTVIQSTLPLHECADPAPTESATKPLHFVADSAAAEPLQFIANSAAAESGVELLQSIADSAAVGAVLTETSCS
jgi:hypothetical protein